MRLKTPIRYYGGKLNMLRHILPNIPEHQIYTEPFFGGGAVFFGKTPAPLEIINDINSTAVNFFFCLKLHFDELNQMVQSSLHSREAYDDAMVMYHNPHLFTRVQRAWAFWVLTNQGFAGKVGTWGYDKKPPGSMTRSIHNKKLEFDQSLADRLSRTQIECADALKVISVRDSPDTFHYIDPPYINTNLGHYGGYTEAHFIQLLDLLVGIEGRFMLSNFPSDILDKYVSERGWNYLTFEKITSASVKRKKKTEVLVANYEIK